MSILDIFRRTTNKNEDAFSPELIESFIDMFGVSADEALKIPGVSAAVNKISMIFASVPFKLYRKETDKNGIKRAVEVEDVRARKINSDTGDLLDGFTLKANIIRDYYLHGGGYAYLNMRGNHIESLNYVEAENICTVSFVGNGYNGITFGSIFKGYAFDVDGKRYNEMDFLRLLRASKNGVNGQSVIKEINNALATLLATNKYFNKLARTGGIKKGFLESQVKLKQEALEKLRAAWNKLYEENSENVVILNEGMKYREASQTAAETQIRDLKNDIEKAVDKVFGIYDDHEKFIKETIAPLLTAFETALNKYYLLESEKDNYYWKADTKELLKPSLKERAEAYVTLHKGGITSTNDLRYWLDLPETKGGDVLSGSLGDVVINPKTGEAIIFNTGAKFNLETFEVITPPASAGAQPVSDTEDKNE